MTPSALIIPLMILSVSGNDAITRQEFFGNVLPATNAIIAPLKISVKRYQRIRKPSFYEKADPARAQLQNYAQYRVLAARKGWLRKGRIVHFVLPPYHWMGWKYIGGMANRTCYKWGAASSVSNATALRSIGTSGYPMSATALAHEVLHGLNLPDDNSPLMSTAALGNTNPRISDANLNRAMQCQGAA